MGNNNTEKINNEKKICLKNKCNSVDTKKIEDEREHRKKILNEQINNVLSGNKEIKHTENELKYYNDLLNKNSNKKKVIIKQILSRNKTMKDCNIKNCIYRYDNANSKSNDNNKNINTNFRLKYVYKPGCQVNLDLNKEIHKNLPNNNSEINLNIGTFCFTRKFKI